jgi:hypothetical protein
MRAFRPFCPPEAVAGKRQQQKQQSASRKRVTAFI